MTVVLNGPQSGATAWDQSMALSGFDVLHITTYSGDDHVRGGVFDDQIDVHTGANTVLARGGDDFVTYATGAANVLDGGAGRDSLRIIQYDRISALVLLVTGSDGVDNYGSQITSFERWIVWGGGVADQVQLGAGRDKFKGFGGDDSALGMAGADRLNGSAGNDVLSGGEGGDHMIGGPGIDRLTGGLGADVFAFGRLERAGDLITDFTSGGDRIAIASAALVGALPLGAVDDAHFHPDFALGPDGQFVYRASSTAGLTELIWDFNGAEAGEEFLVALFSGGPTMAATDIDILA